MHSRQKGILNCYRVKIMYPFVNVISCLYTKNNLKSNIKHMYLEELTPNVIIMIHFEIK